MLTGTLGNNTKQIYVVLGFIREALENAKGSESLFMD